jgi:RNA polymerase sigma-70 factor (ECF subfamily)
MAKSDSGHEKPAGSRQDESAAVEQLFQRYALKLAHLAEQHLSRQVARRQDGEDVVQSVFRTFFRRCTEGKFKIDSSAQIWKLLAMITLMKARAKGRYETADKRDAGAEAPDGDAQLMRARSREPGPVDALTLVDEINHLVSGLPSEYRDLLELRLRGHSGSEIAKELGVSRRTVHRALNLLQERALKTASGSQE